MRNWPMPVWNAEIAFASCPDWNFSHHDKNLIQTFQVRSWEYLRNLGWQKNKIKHTSRAIVVTRRTAGTGGSGGGVLVGGRGVV